MRPTITAFFLASLTATAACQGEMHVGLDARGSTEERNEARWSDPSKRVEDHLCEEPNVAFTPLRRVTRADFVSSVEDLLSLDASRLVRLPADELAASFVPSNTSQPVSVTGADLYHEAATAIAESVDLDRVISCERAEPACVRTFAESFASRAYRRPLDEAEVERLVHLHDAVASEAGRDAGYRATIATVLQSPFFLYYLEGGASEEPGQVLGLTQLELAARLAAFLWNSIPDRALVDRALAGELATREQVEETAREMLADPRARRVVANFHLQWLEIADIVDAEKSTELVGDEPDALLWSMEQETRLFVEHVLFEDDAKLSTLLTADYSFVNRPLAEHYGLNADALFGATTPPSGLDPRRAVSVNFVGAPDRSVVVDWEGHRPTEDFGVFTAASWNQADGAGGRLESVARDDGRTTDVSIQWGSEGVRDGTRAGGVPRDEIGPNGRMMAGAIHSTDAALQVVVEGLTPQVVGSTYDVYVYFDGSRKMRERRTTFTIGDRVQIGLEGEHRDDQDRIRSDDFFPHLDGHLVESSADAEGNYVVFRGVSGTAFTLKAENHPSNYDGLESQERTSHDLGVFVNGLQVVGRPERKDAPAPTDFVRVELPPDERIGLLTQGSFLAAHAHREVTSPVKRGAVILENMVRCVPFPSPDELEIDSNVPERTAGTTTREQIHALTVENSNCAGCHTPINHVGYAFEHFDAAGSWRDVDGARPVDSSTDLTSVAPLGGRVDGAAELARKLAENEHVADCVARQWLRYAMRREVSAAEECSLEHVSTTFRESGYDLRELLVAITTTDAFRFRRTAPRTGLENH